MQVRCTARACLASEHCCLVLNKGTVNYRISMRFAGDHVALVAGRRLAIEDETATAFVGMTVSGAPRCLADVLAAHAAETCTVD
eukprot:354325-Chlamydomonas_euryale.AAC.4